MTKPVKIDRKLYLVIPVTLTDGTEVFVHSAPVSADVFDTYFLPIAKTFSSIYNSGLGVLAGPRVADKMLKKVARELGEWDGPGGVANGLIAEIHRLTLVLMPTPNGWQMVPYDEAVKNTLAPEDVAEIEAALTFFMLASTMHRHSEQKEILAGAAMLWGARLESSNATELLNSLRTSNAPENTGATVVGLSVRSSTG
jgi:hypothetical protein